MRRQKLQTNSGFMAIMSAVIISVVLLLIVTNLSLTGFYNRSNILDGELKERSSALAEACLEKALVELKKNPAYTGGVSVTVSGSETCDIENISPASDPILIETTATFQNSVTNLQVEVDHDDLLIESWQECKTLSTC